MRGGVRGTPNESDMSTSTIDRCVNKDIHPKDVLDPRYGI